MGFSPLWWSWLTTDIYRTAKGESIGTQLSDGSRIDLNIDTKLSIQYAWTKRSVRLEHGEALLHTLILMPPPPGKKAGWCSKASP